MSTVTTYTQDIYVTVDKWQRSKTMFTPYKFLHDVSYTFIKNILCAFVRYENYYEQATLNMPLHPEYVF